MKQRGLLSELNATLATLEYRLASLQREQLALTLAIDVLRVFPERDLDIVVREARRTVAEHRRRNTSGDKQN